ncbi:MAG: hypothetical protein P1V97_04410 [Planctomycetota bacterium]|nr:hypothetical protein [Planctomycetota bacterium]
MTSDDPEKQIRELEELLAEAKKLESQAPPTPSAPPAPPFNPLSDWVGELSDWYRSGEVTAFLLTGNIYDDCLYNGKEGLTTSSLTSFLSDYLFGSRDSTLVYHPGQGIDVNHDNGYDDFRSFVTKATKNSDPLPRDWDKATRLIDRYVLARSTSQRKKSFRSFGVIISHLQDCRDPHALARFSAMAEDPYTRPSFNFTLCLLAPDLKRAPEGIVCNPRICRLNVALPRADQRKAFIESMMQKHPELDELLQLPVGDFVDLTAVTPLIVIQKIIKRAVAVSATIDADALQRLTRDFI